MQKWLFVTVMLVGFGGPAAAATEPVGVLEGKIELSGPPPAMPDLPRFSQSGRPRDLACATRETARWVSVEDGGVADVLVRLSVGAARTPPPSSPAVIDQHNCIYLPRVLGIVAGQAVAYRNSDPTMHNIHTYLPNGDVDFNDAQPEGFADKVAPVPAPAGDKPYRVACDVHPWMESFVWITDHKYFTVTGADGRFRLETPPGTYTLEALHPNLGKRTAKVKVLPGKTVTVKFPPYKTADYKAK